MMDFQFYFNKYIRKRRTLDGYLYQWEPISTGAHSETVVRPTILQKGSVFVDVGANVGAWSIPASRYYRDIHAFEAYPPLAKILVKNARMNRIRNITVHPVALGDRQEQRDFWIYHDPALQGSFDTNPDLKFRKRAHFGFLETKTLDSFNLIPTVLKIDTEGYEISVLQGAKNTIEKFKPVLVVEAHYMEDVNKIAAMLPGYNWSLHPRPGQTLMVGHDYR